MIVAPTPCSVIFDPEVRRTFPQTNHARAEHPGEKGVLATYVMDLIRDRNRCCVSMPPYYRFIANASENLSLQAFWRDLRCQNEEELQRPDYGSKTEIQSDAVLRERVERPTEKWAAPWVGWATR